MFEQPPLSFAIRLLILGLLAAGFLTRPMLAFAGEVHEAHHAIEGEHDLHEQMDAEDSTQPGEPERKDSWHALMHLGHFCGQCMALVPGPGTDLRQPFVRTQPVASAFATEFESIAAPALFRPPISR